MNDPKQLVNRFVEELWNERRLDVADAIFAQDCVTHQLQSGGPGDAVPRGPQAIKEHVAGWIASFPDLRFSIEQMLSEGDRVVMQMLMEGHAPGRLAGNSRERQEDADTDVHRPPGCAGQDRRGLGAGGIARLFSATWNRPEYRRLGGQFLAAARRC